MATVEIYGASDDLIEVEGDLREELDGGDETTYLAFSDGTVLSVEYDNEGFWRIKQRRAGTASFAKSEGNDVDKNYTDRVTLTGDLSWFVAGQSFVPSRKER